MRVDKFQPPPKHQTEPSENQQLQVEEKAGGLVWSGLVCGVHHKLKPK
jgi:hypothetical protein